MRESLKEMLDSELFSDCTIKVCFFLSSKIFSVYTDELFSKIKFPGPADPRLHAKIVRLRAGLPRLFSSDGHHHLRHDHVLRGEEDARH